MIELDRAELLRLGAGGLVAMGAAALLPGAANAQEPAPASPAPAPEEDDVAFLSFAAVGERASRDLYRAALRQKASGLLPLERRQIDRVASAKRAHIRRIDAALGADAPTTADFETVLLPGAVTSRARILALAAQLETLLVRVYLNGIGATIDPSKRLLLGRLLTYDAQALSWLRADAGKASPAGLYRPIDLEPAARELDKFLTTPAFPD